MSIKDMKVTIDQVLSLRDEVIRVERQRDQLAEALECLLRDGKFIDGFVKSEGAKEKARDALKAMEDE